MNSEIVDEIKYLGLGDHKCKTGVIQIKQTDKGYWNIFWTSHGETHQNTYGPAISVDFDKDGNTVLAFESKITMWPAEDKEKAARFIKHKVQSALTFYYDREHKKLTVWKKIKSWFTKGD